MVSPKVEDVLAWLAREEVNLADINQIRQLQGRLALAGLQKGAAWQAILSRTATYVQQAMLSQGIRPVAYEFPTGTQVRFVLPGQRGAFGYATVQARYGLETYVPKE